MLKVNNHYHVKLPHFKRNVFWQQRVFSSISRWFFEKNNFFGKKCLRIERRLYQALTSQLCLLLPWHSWLLPTSATTLLHGCGTLELSFRSFMPFLWPKVSIYWIFEEGLCSWISSKRNKGLKGSCWKVNIILARKVV